MTTSYGGSDFRLICEWAPDISVFNDRLGSFRKRDFILGGLIVFDGQSLYQVICAEMASLVVKMVRLFFFFFLSF